MSDQELIRELTARYNHTFDRKDVPGWVECWTADGYFERFESQPRARGSEQLALLLSSFPVRGRHIVTDQLIKVDGDTATQESYLLYLDVGDGVEISMSGIYRDQLVRAENHWLFRERIFVPDYLASGPGEHFSLTDHEPSNAEETLR